MMKLHNTVPAGADGVVGPVFRFSGAAMGCDCRRSPLSGFFPPAAPGAKVVLSATE